MNTEGIGVLFDQMLKIHLFAGLRAAIAGICLLVLLTGPLVSTALAADNDNTFHLQAVNYLTWWFHDATGYHPAIKLRVENASGVDLTGVTLKFQARFTNLRTGYVNVDREERRESFKPRQRITIFLTAPRAYELPIDQNLWPRIECKVMCRVGEVGDSGTQTLLVRKLDSVTMSLDAAKSLLSKQPDIRIRRAPKKLNPIRKFRKEKALVAMAGKLGSKGKPRSVITLAKFISSSALPGLGDDFYKFEKKYGLPLETDTGDANWVWASYSVEALDLNVIVGSRGKTGKADMIVSTIPAQQVKGESQLISLARSMSGKFRGESTSPPNHAVRYLPTGRLEFGTVQSKNYRAAYFTPSESPTKSHMYTVVVTRLPGNVLNIVRKESKKARLLRFLASITGADGA